MTDLDPAVIERAAEAIADVFDQRQTQQLETCPAGCGCRRMTEDPDRRDCACDGPCCMDPDWWDGFTDSEVAARAAAGVIVPATAEAIAAAIEATQVNNAPQFAAIARSFAVPETSDD